MFEKCKSNFILSGQHLTFYIQQIQIKWERIFMSRQKSKAIEHKCGIIGGNWNDNAGNDANWKVWIKQIWECPSRELIIHNVIKLFKSLSIIHKVTSRISRSFSPKAGFRARARKAETKLLLMDRLMVLYLYLFWLGSDRCTKSGIIFIGMSWLCRGLQ